MQLQPNTPLQEGKYIIKQLLGQGGFGNTYIAYNTEFEETVAIKEFFMKGVTERDETTSFVSVSNSENVPVFEEQKEKFKKEARRLRRLRSEHIVKVHDLFEENGTAYYEMDYIEGESLAERMKHTGTPFTEAEVDQILGQVLGALKEVHQSEIWHLDLKPGNIMLDNNGKAYLIDFGASKQIRSNGNVTTSTALCYTPGYAPNEQIGQMFDRLGPWTDIYALGATLYNILTNQKPPMTVDIEEDEEDAFDFPPTLSEKKREMIVWMMQPKRKARPQSVDEILSKLKEPKTAPQAQKTNSAAKDDEATVLIQQTAVPSEETVIVGVQQNVLLNAVDLGLSNLWADYNAGANTENLPGDLYDWNTATAKVWGNNWRLPSREDWKELVQKCQWYRQQIGNVWGYRIFGPNENEIFLPTTGLRWDERISNKTIGYYWTCELCIEDKTKAYYYYFDMESKNTDINTRNFTNSGRAVRLVCKR